MAVDYTDADVVIKRHEQMHQLFLEGVIGTKEFRNWLAKVDQIFEEVRDSSVDDEIDTLARARAEERRTYGGVPTEEEPTGI